MKEPILVLHDDPVAERWEPFALTRPAGELIFGTLTLRARAERVFGRCAVHLAAAHLQGFSERDAPRVGTLADVPGDVDRLFWLSRAVPAWGAVLDAARGAGGPLRIGDTVVGWYAPAGEPAPSLDRLGARADGAEPVLPGRVLEHVWELMSGNPLQISVDIDALHPTTPPHPHPSGVHILGAHAIILGEGASIEPGAVLDATAGPIWLDRGVTVDAFTRLAGPAYIGPDSHLLGGTIASVSTGPVCRLHGELTTTVCLGYVNKQHDGHIGHAYLGSWVNLGSGTTNSDLKNNYGSIRIWTPDGEVDTGEIKMGSLVGDHVKTGIGLLLNTGTVVGAGSNLYGAAMPPKCVPPFSWGTGDELVEYRLDRFLEVAERAMARREVELDEGERGQLERAWQRARGAGASAPPPGDGR
jgi:UDP-N-acetylglucosamine diphosphorylase/glucosamine-1-phosphate N-acetyltransferase